MQNIDIITLADRIIADETDTISTETALMLTALSGQGLIDLLAAASRIRRACLPSPIFTCAILNAKSGKCSQDCAFCAQSAHHHTGIDTYPLMKKSALVANALAADAHGATFFSMVTSGERLSDEEIDTICHAASEIREKTRLTLCGSLGMLSAGQAAALRESGLRNYHHNLETAESFFDHICTTHPYASDIDTLRAAGAAGLAVCSGGILGLGESWAQRVELAFTLRDLNVTRIPLNFLIPIAGTRLAHQPPITPMDALKSIALFRFINPRTDITICGGRGHVLQDYQSWIFMAGANGVMVGNYLTTPGRDLEADLRMIQAWENTFAQK